MALWVEKLSSLFPCMKPYLDTHLRVVHYCLDYGKRCVVLGLFFSSSGHVLGPCLDEVGLWVETQISQFPHMKPYLDTHYKVLHYSLDCE
jgi:hypothetical protein